MTWLNGIDKERMVSESKEWSSKRSNANDLALTSAAARKVSKFLKTWQRRRGLRWVLLKRLMLLLVLTMQSMLGRVCAESVKEGGSPARLEPFLGSGDPVALPEMDRVSASSSDSGASFASSSFGQVLLTKEKKLLKEKVMVVAGREEKETGFNKKHRASDSVQCFVPGIQDDEASFSFSVVEPPINRALDYVWKERKGEKLGVCTKIFARSNSVLHSRCLVAATVKHDNILAHHTNRHVVVSIVRRTTPIIAASSSAATSSSTLSGTKFGTKFGTIVVAETTSWMEAFRSIQQEFNLVLILPIVVICFGAAVIATSLASMRCCAVEKKKKRT